MRVFRLIFKSNCSGRFYLVLFDSTHNDKTSRGITEKKGNIKDILEKF